MVPIMDTIWTRYELLDTVEVDRPDSLFIFLGAGVTEVAGGWTSYDLCSFVELR